MSHSNERETCKPALPLAKAEGAFFALAAGDALGWPQEMPRNVKGKPGNIAPHVEFEEWTRRSGGRFRPYEEIIRPGDYSDDTQLALAVARSRTDHGPAWWKAFTRMELPLWTLYERGGGGATKRAAKAWCTGGPPWKSDKNDEIRRYFDAGGNGVAMRVLPHSLFLAGQEDPAALMHDVILDGSATHGHPRALIGATVYAYAAWWLARRSDTLRFGELLDALIGETSEWSRFPDSGRSRGAWFEAADTATGGHYESIWQQTVREMGVLLEKARKGLQAGVLADDHTVLRDLGCFGRTKGAGTSSAAAAVYLASRHAAQPVQGVLEAAFETGADTDTLAAMTGGLMGCLSGTEWLPSPWLEVQDAGYLRSIADRIASGPEGAGDNPVELLRNPQSVFRDLALLNGSQQMDLGGLKQVVATALPDPKSIGKSIVVRAWQLRTSGGQTMYVTKVEHPTTDRSQRRGDESPPVDSRPSEGRVAEKPVIRCSKNALYLEFWQQLQILMQGRSPMKTKEIMDGLDLVKSQVDTWLERAQRDRWIQRTSQRPAKFELVAKPLLDGFGDSPSRVPVRQD